MKCQVITEAFPKLPKNEQGHRLKITEAWFKKCCDLSQFYLYAYSFPV